MLSILGSDIVERIPNVLTKECGVNCFNYFAIVKTSLSMVIYHGFLMVVLLQSKSGDGRSVLHNGLWPLKFLLWIASFVGCFFINDSVLVDFWIPAYVFSFLFILLEVFLLIDFTCTLAESWLERFERGESAYKWLLICITAIFYAGVIAITVFLYLHYAKCPLNQFFISTNLILCIIVSILPLIEKIREINPRFGLMQTALISLYSTKLVYSALSGQLDEANQCSDYVHPSLYSQQILKMVTLVFTFLSLGYAAFSAGTSVPQGPQIDIESNDPNHDIEYNYSFFHFVFVLASFSLLTSLSNWTQSSISNQIFDFHYGNSSMWARIVASWLTFLLFIWVLIAPIILKNRSFN
jgi:hypothetical protein